MIHLYLVRHGIAADAAPGFPDHARPLTAEGRARFRRLARAFARLGEPLDLVFTSPLVRAVQTAELLAGAIGRDDVGVLEQLEPQIPAAELFAEVGRRATDGQSVALVGHDPQMSAAVALAAGLAPRESMNIDFRKGSIVRIDVKALPKTQPAQPRWWMKPKRRELVKGLPIVEPKAHKGGAKSKAKAEEPAAKEKAVDGPKKEGTV
jgi:phosphohistidine phosphatase